MKPMLWFVLGLLVAMSGQALAQYVDEYGNSLDYLRSYSPQPGAPSVRDSRGYLSPAPELPTHRTPC